MQSTAPILGESKTSRTVFLGGIPLDITAKKLVVYLSTFDKVEKIHLPKNSSSGVLKGYAKAVLASTDGVHHLVSQPIHRIGGLSVGIIKWQNQSSYLNRKDKLGERKVHVRIPPEFPKETLENYFSKYGVLNEVIVKRHPFTKEPRNFCYLIYSSKGSALKAVAESPHNVGGTYLHTSMSRQTKDKETEDDKESSGIQILSANHAGQTNHSLSWNDHENTHNQSKFINPNPGIAEHDECLDDLASGGFKVIEQRPYKGRTLVTFIVSSNFKQPEDSMTKNVHTDGYSTGGVPGSFEELVSWERSLCKPTQKKYHETKLYDQYKTNQVHSRNLLFRVAAKHVEL